MENEGGNEREWKMNVEKTSPEDEERQTLHDMTTV